MADITKYNSEVKVFWQRTEELLNELQGLQRDTQSIGCPCSNPDCPFNSKNTRAGLQRDTLSIDCPCNNPADCPFNSNKTRARAGSELCNSSAHQQFLTSSLPATSEDSKKRRSLDADGLEAPVSLQRPRSASFHISNIRRSLRRGLSRARPSSARSGKAKLHGAGDVYVLGREVSTREVDNAFARIKQQLAQFSEEDQVLKDRVDKLIEEINDIKVRNPRRAPAKRLQYQRSSSEQPNSPKKHLEQREKIVTAPKANLVPLNSKLKPKTEMELHTRRGSESQVILLRVTEPESNPACAARRRSLHVQQEGGHCMCSKKEVIACAARRRSLHVPD